jgi:periplasmic nitrate reductase NapD
MTTQHIASFIVRVRPEIADHLAARIARMPGMEVPAVESGKIIVVAEAPSERALAERMEALRDQPDVLMVSLVFHQMDDEMEAEPT